MRVSDLISDLGMLVPEKAWKAGSPPLPDRKDAAGAEEAKKEEEGTQKKTAKPKPKLMAFPQPFWEHAIVRRISRPRMQIEYLPFNLGKALLKKDRNSNLALQPGDTVIVFSKWDFVKRPMARVGGAVNREGTYPLTPGMRLRDLLSIAGGLKSYAFRGQAELMRVHFEAGGQREERILISLGEVLGGAAKHNIVLQERDHLFVRSVPEHKAAATVTISGEVRFPGTYPVRRGERLSSVLERAGGFTAQAYCLGAKFTRESVRKLQQERLNQMLTRLEAELSRSAAAAAQTGASKEAAEAAAQQAAWQQKLLGRLRSAKAIGRVVIRLAAADKLKGTAQDIALEKGDVLKVPARQNTVSVLGTVHNQNAYLWKKKSTYKHYLRQAGGPTRFADKKSIYVIRADGSVASLRQGRGGLRWDAARRRWVSGGLKGMPLNPGDTVIVPEELDHVAWLRNTKDITQILYQIAVATGVVLLAL
jgi:protein involved in polysaccharide export with SLBB domain